VRSVVGDRFSGERAIAFETVKLNCFVLELLLDGDVVAEFTIVLVHFLTILQIISS
jgi:hypothetical protein